MINTQHTIQKQLFDIRFTVRSEVQQLYARISQLSGGVLTQAEEQLFNEMVPDDFHIRIDKLDIDVGSIKKSELESVLTGRIISALREKIDLLIAANKFSPETETPGVFVQRRLENELTLLEYYLLSGSIPWWAVNKNDTDLNTLLARLTTGNSQAVSLLLKRIGTYDYVRKRLAYQLKEKVIQQVVTVLEPDNAEFIIGYHKNISDTHKKDPIVPAEASDFEKAVWELIFTYLLVERGSYFNEKEFVKMNIRQIASKYNIEFRSLLHLLYSSLHFKSVLQNRSAQLQKIIIDLEQDVKEDEQFEYEFPQQALKPGNVSAELLAGKLAILKHYLLFGTLPLQANNYSIRDLQSVWLELIQAVPQTLLLMITNVSSAYKVERLMLFINSESLLEGAIKLANPFKNTLVLYFIQALSEIEESSFNASQDARKVTLQALFEFMLSSANSSLDMVGLVSKTLTALARSQNVSMLYLAEALHAEEERKATNVHINASQLVEITRQLLEQDVKIIKLQDEKKQQEDKDADDDAFSVTIRDVLRYLIKTGLAPWWGRALLTQRSPQEMFDHLITQSPNDAIVLLKYAGQDAVMQNRFLRMFLPESVIPVFKKAGTGDSTFVLYRSFLLLLKEYDDVSKMFNESEREKLLLKTLWQELIKVNYSAISNELLIVLFVYQLADNVNIEPYVLANNLIALQEKAQTSNNEFVKDLLQKAIILFEKEEVPKKLPQTFLALLQEKISLNKIKNTHSSEERITIVETTMQNSKTLALLFVEEKQLWSSDEERYAGTQIFKELESEIIALTYLDAYTDKQYNASAGRKYTEWLLEELEFFLTTGKLRQEASLSAQEALHIISAIVTVLFITDNDGLTKRLLQSEGYKPAVLLNIYFTFSQAQGTMERRVGALLKPIAEHKLGEYVSQNNMRPLSLREASRLIKENKAAEQNAVKSTDGILQNKNNESADEVESNNKTAATRLIDEVNVRAETNRLEVPGEDIRSNENASPNPAEAVDVFEYKVGNTPIGFTGDEAWHPVNVIAQYILPKEGAATKIFFVREAYNVIDHFFKTGSLPDNLRSLPNSETDRFLKELMLLLFRERKDLLAALLSTKSTNTTGARFKMYDLFMPGLTIEDRSVNSFFTTYLQQDITVYVSATADLPASSKEESIEHVVSEYLKDLQPTAINELLSSNKSVSLSLLQYLLAKHGEKVLYTLLKDTILKKIHENPSALLESIESMWELPAMSGDDKTKLHALFIKFNMLFLTGKMHINTAGDYMISFFKFLLSQQTNISRAGYQQLYLEADKRKTESANTFKDHFIMITYLIGEKLQQTEDKIQLQKQLQNEQDEAQLLLYKKEMLMKEKKEAEQLQAEIKKNEEKRAEEERKKEQLLAKDKKDKLYINNAGLVLLAPFFNPFFSKLGLMEQGNFVDDAARERSVLLLQYLATGMQNFHEHELALNKILCNVPLEQAIPIEIVITENEKEITEQLLKMVLQRWEKMKNSSIEGFRASFLIRDGALTETIESWNLRVEQKSYDILLQFLPWGFTMIKSSWMDKIIYVEWT